MVEIDAPSHRNLKFDLYLNLFFCVKINIYLCRFAQIDLKLRQELSVIKPRYMMGDTKRNVVF